MPELCPSSKLPTPPRRLKLREATSGKLGGGWFCTQRGEFPGAACLTRCFGFHPLERKIRSPWARAKAAPLQVPPLSPWRLPDTPNDEAFGFKRLPDLGDLVALDFDGPIFHRTTGAARRAQLLSRFLDL